MGIRKAYLGLVAAALAVAAAGCGGGSDDGGSGEVAGDLRVVHNWTGPEGEAFQAVIDGFEAKYPDVNAELEQVPFDQTQSLLTQQFVQGGPPDVAVGLPGIVRNFASQDLLLELDDTWDAWVDDGQYTESLRDVASAGTDHAYAVYFKGNVNGLIWYTPAELEKLGVEVPTTWADFTAAMDQAAAGGVAPVAVGGKDSWPLTQWADPIVLGVAGPEAFNALARGEIGWDDPAIVEAFETYADVAENYFPENALGTGFVDATCARASNKALFQNQGAFVSLITPAECDKSLVPGEDFAFFKMPQPDESAPPAQAVSGDLFFGAKDTENEAATKALLEYLGSVEAQSIWAERGGYIAPNAKVGADAYPTEIDRAAAELWPTDASVAAGYDLDDWIGGEVQAKYTQALQQLVRDYDVDAFISAMTQVDTRSQ
ncbi:MAG: extracellular solute-binding protein [Actinomycetes bacterium]